MEMKEDVPKKSAHKIQTTGNHPIKIIQHPQQGEILKSRIIFVVHITGLLRSYERHELLAHNK